MNNKKYTINIIGRGNVGGHLVNAFSDKAIVVEVNPHTLKGLSSEADFTLISVKDDAIESVINQLPNMSGVVAHTSGSVAIDVFKGSGCSKYGVFYPLQTFSKEKALDYSRIPFFIEGANQMVEDSLIKLGYLISENVKQADSEKRKTLHIAAVFSCNFVNHLWSLSSDFLRNHNLDFNDLLPLIEETTKKIEKLSPKEAQTGPAVRKDMHVIDKHLAFLKEEPHLAKIYKCLSQSIINAE